ncbi:MAG: hypothetical protein ACKVUT_16650 [Gaiella sp.]
MRPSRGHTAVDRYGEGSVPAPIREIFARPGVVVATSGTELPRRYREKGARTVFFVLNLPRLIGEPGDAASPEQVQAMAAQTYERAVASTECATPIIALNELLAPAAPVPWNANIRAYRTNVLELLRALATEAPGLSSSSTATRASPGRLLRGGSRWAQSPTSRTRPTTRHP